MFKTALVLSILIISSNVSANDFLSEKSSYNKSQVAFDDGNNELAKNLLAEIKNPLFDFFKKDLSGDIAFDESRFEDALTFYLSASLLIEKDNLELKELLLSKIQYTRQKIKKH